MKVTSFEQFYLEEKKKKLAGRKKKKGDLPLMKPVDGFKGGDFTTNKSKPIDNKGDKPSKVECEIMDRMYSQYDTTKALSKVSIPSDIYKGADTDKIKRIATKHLKEMLEKHRTMIEVDGDCVFYKVRSVHNNGVDISIFFDPYELPTV